MTLHLGRRRSLLASLLGVVVVVVVVIVSVWLLTGIRSATTSSGTSTAASADERWACAMMDYVGPRTQDGRCPQCGMVMEMVQAGALTSQQRRRMGISTVSVASGPAQVQVRGYGTAHYDARFQRIITSFFDCEVVRLHTPMLARESDVAAGEPLIDVTSPAIAALQRQLADAHREGNQQVISSVSEQFAGWGLAHVSQAILAGAQPSETVSIVSPFAGRLSFPERLPDGKPVPRLRAGGSIQRYQTLFTLAPVSLTLIVHVPEMQSRFLRVGQRVIVASDDHGEMPDLDARIGWLSPDILPDIRAREARVFVEDAKHRIFGGSMISARFQANIGEDLEAADPDDATSWGTFVQVPKSAVLSTGVRNVAWKQMSDGKSFVLAELVLGPRLEDAHGDDRYIVLSGLSAGDVVATQGAFLIDSQAQLAGTPCLLFPDGSVPPARP
ncbi:MAG: efflux RND transporter periplasmic adaptor subunit [Planctomycetes bacterium]|nr:efflux RND transporter periplasmic adaptor subunit [Planctomycetota bacterium]